jgi:hypothetical protein
MPAQHCEQPLRSSAADGAHLVHLAERQEDGASWRSVELVLSSAGLRGLMAQAQRRQLVACSCRSGVLLHRLRSKQSE